MLVHIATPAKNRFRFELLFSRITEVLQNLSDKKLKDPTFTSKRLATPPSLPIPQSYQNFLSTAIADIVMIKILVLFFIPDHPALKPIYHSHYHNTHPAFVKTVINPKRSPDGTFS
jgi:hypothetical protein